MNVGREFKGQLKCCYFSKGIYNLKIFVLITLILQQCLNNYNGAEAKTLNQRNKKPLKLLKSSSSLIQLRHKRDVFTNEQHRQQESQPFVKDNMKYYKNLDINDDDDYYYDDDVIPKQFDDGSQIPLTLDDQISEKAKQVAESFSNMWKSLGDSIKHCMEALRGLFEDDDDDDAGDVKHDINEGQNNDFTRAIWEQQYDLKQEYDNEVVMER